MKSYHIKVLEYTKKILREFQQNVLRKFLKLILKMTTKLEDSNTAPKTYWAILNRLL